MKDLNLEEIGLRIRQTRKEQHLSLKDVADKVNVHVATISRYELGKISDIKLPVLDSIAMALNVSPLWLMGISEDVHNDLYDKKILVAKFEKLNDDGKQRLFEYLDMLLKGYGAK